MEFVAFIVVTAVLIMIACIITAMICGWIFGRAMAEAEAEIEDLRSQLNPPAQTFLDNPEFSLPAADDESMQRYRDFNSIFDQDTDNFVADHNLKGD
jgi:hypothetical protein